MDPVRYRRLASIRRIGSGDQTVTLSLSGKPCVGIEVQLIGGVPLGPASLAVHSAGRSYLVSGELAQAVTPKFWTEVGQGDDFTVFRSHLEPKAAWVQPTTIASEVQGRPARVPTTSPVSSAAVLSRGLELGSAKVVASTPTSATIEVAHARSGALGLEHGLRPRDGEAEITLAHGPTAPGRSATRRARPRRGGAQGIERGALRLPARRVPSRCRGEPRHSRRMGTDHLRVVALLPPTAPH